MRELSKVQILEEVYLYETYEEKDLHINSMEFRGYSVTRNNPFQTNDLVVTYQMRKAVDNIARL